MICLTTGGSGPVSCCLDALAGSAGGRTIECIVPFDERLPDIEQLRGRFAWVRWVDARAEIAAAGIAGLSHEHHHLLRSVGLRHAQGAIIALLEDHGPPDVNWVSALLEAHKQSRAGAIGGAVENTIDRPMNWARYFCDFGRLQAPIPRGSTFVSDVNIAYKREALAAVAAAWRSTFVEPAVRRALQNCGWLVEIRESMLTYQVRPPMRLGAAAVERWVWGRSYAGRRAQHLPAVRRWTYALLSPLLPLVRGGRIVRRAWPCRRTRGHLIRALPVLALLEVCWALGELSGYVVGQAAGAGMARSERPEAECNALRY